jgi:hypothetical protein
MKTNMATVRIFDVTSMFDMFNRGNLYRSYSLNSATVIELRYCKSLVGNWLYGFRPELFNISYNVRGHSTTSDHQLYRVTPLKTPVRLLIRLLQSQPHVTTITHIYYAVTRLHNYNPYTSIFHSLIVSITHIYTSNKHSVHK